MRESSHQLNRWVWRSFAIAWLGQESWALPFLYYLTPPPCSQWAKPLLLSQWLPCWTGTKSKSSSPLVSGTTVPEAVASLFLARPQPVHQASVFTAASQVLPASTVTLLGAGCWAGLGKISFLKEFRHSGSYTFDRLWIPEKQPISHRGFKEPVKYFGAKKKNVGLTFGPWCQCQQSWDFVFVFSLWFLYSIFCLVF